MSKNYSSEYESISTPPGLKEFSRRFIEEGQTGGDGDDFMSFFSSEFSDKIASANSELSADELKAVLADQAEKRSQSGGRRRKKSKKKSVRRSVRRSVKRSRKTSKRKSVRRSRKRPARRSNKAKKTSRRKSVRRSRKRSKKTSKKRSKRKSAKRSRKKSAKRSRKKSAKRSRKKSKKKSVRRSRKKSKKKSVRRSRKRSKKRSKKRSRKRSRRRAARGSNPYFELKNYMGGKVGNKGPAAAMLVKIYQNKVSSSITDKAKILEEAKKLFDNDSQDERMKNFEKAKKNYADARAASKGKPRKRRKKKSQPMSYSETSYY